MNKSWWQQFEGRAIDNTYVLKRLLGIGGFGGVFLADHVVESTLVRHVAVKLIVSDADQMQRQLNELVVATTLRHPSLLSCFHAGATTFAGMKLLYLVMELADEGLQTRLEKGILSPSDTLLLTKSLAQGLAYLHERKRVHRDVKPANVLLVEGVWKLSDFGTVRQSSDTTSRTNLVMGTITYMPPESFDGVVSPAWDVWSLGILILRALTGQGAYAETSEHRLMRAILLEDPLIPSNLPTPFTGIVRGCLIKNYRDRWSCARVMRTLEDRLQPKEPALTAVEPPAVMPSSAVPQEPRLEQAHSRDSPLSPTTLVEGRIDRLQAMDRKSRPWRSIPLMVALGVCLLAAGVYYLVRPGSSEQTATPNTRKEPQETQRSNAGREKAPQVPSQIDTSQKRTMPVAVPAKDDQRRKPTNTVQHSTSRASTAPPPSPAPKTGPAQLTKRKMFKDAAEYDLYAAITKDTNPTTRLEKLKAWKERYPTSDFSAEREQLIATSNSELSRLHKPNDDPARSGPGLAPSPAPTLYQIGQGVSAPIPIYKPEPEYSEEARKAKLQGTVLVSFVVDEKGNTRDIKVIRSLGMGLDQKAIEAVQKWKFRAAMKDGQPVPVQLITNTTFRLL